MGSIIVRYCRVACLDPLDNGYGALAAQISATWSASDRKRNREMAAELVAVRPDVLLTNGPTTPAVRQATSTIPIVFVGVADPVGGGFVSSLAHPGGNLTGFAAMEYVFSAKWLQLLKQIAPAVTNVKSRASGRGSFHCDAGHTCSRGIAA